MSIEMLERASAAATVAREPTSVEQTGLDLAMIADLAPKDLVDEAFLRRIQNKVHVTNPTVEIFREIFRRQCESLGVSFDQNGLVYLLREHDVKPKGELRSVHPRDILRTLAGIARYRDVPPALTPELIDRARQTYFVDL